MMSGAETFLDLLVSRPDSYGFMDVTGNWNNHRPMLLIGLALTIGRPVVEYGSGDGSTPLLRKYCEDHLRSFSSYDSDEGWAKTTGAEYRETWQSFPLHPCGLAFLDLAPGEFRRKALVYLKDYAEIIVAHDTELGGAGDYRMEPELKKFKYRLDLNLTAGGAGCTMVSDSIEVDRFRGLQFGKFKFDI